jgi:peptidoglycan/xylan/chitin deacetylase (PgdA/CDA1 family)
MRGRRILAIIGLLSITAPLAAIVAWRATRHEPRPRMVVARVIPKPNRPQVQMEERFAVPVLMYHRIADLTERESHSPLMRDLTVSPADFEAQVSYLAEQGFTFLLARDVERAVKESLPLPRKAVAITMDDGYKDKSERAFPILRKHGAVATIFLVSSTIDTAGHLSWDDCRLMRRDRVGYGSHTVHHYDLPTLPTPEIDYELRESKRAIEANLFDTVTAVAYPSGRYNKTVTERAEAAGYLAGWKKGGGPVQPGTDMYLLPRVRVNGADSLADFQLIVWSGMNLMRDRADDERHYRYAARKSPARRSTRA